MNLDRHGWGPGFSDTPGYVLTAATNGNGDELIDGLGRRPNAKIDWQQWYNVTSVNYDASKKYRSR
ncbi:Phage tail fiber [Salmonella enterica subsp. enterica]|uniref:Phage tail fiber n=1 Tax=Salmonella enterica I TaxID=59201 RepID=A0A447Q048_SALET|nr:Phage tail fiber [Salmonella enterica subsp. enterica]